MWKIAEDLKQISLGKFEKCWPDDFQIYLNLYDNAICNAWKSSLFVMW